MNIMIDKIATEWNKPVGVPVNDEPTFIHRDKGMLMFHLLQEEMFELRDAIANNYKKPLTTKGRIIEIADALGDILYLTYGAVSQYGVKEMFEDIKFDVNSIDEEIVFENITRIINNFREVIQDDDKTETIKLSYIALSLKELQEVVLSYAATVSVKGETLAYYMPDVVKEIHRSNLTKKEKGKFLFRKDNKVIKGRFFEEPRIQSILF